MKRSGVRARRVPPEAPNAARGTIWRTRKQPTDFTDFTEKSEAASNRRTPAGPVAAHLEDTPSWSRAVAGGQAPSWTARAGGGPVFLPEIIYVRFSKRTHMTAPGKTWKHRFPKAIRVIRSPGAKKSKSFFTKRSQMKSDCRLEPSLRKPSPLPASSVAFGAPASAGLRPSRRSGQTPVQVSPSQSKSVQVSPSQSKSVRVSPSQSKSVRVSPSQSESVQVSPSQSKSVQVSPSQSKSVRVSPSQSK